MKNRRFSLAILLLLVFSLLLNGCAARNPDQQITPPSNQSIAPGQNSNHPATTSSGLLKVHFIDVGQGDAILVQTPAGQNMLVDAGENDQGDKVVNYLTAQGVKSLDVVVGTHPHSDHIGGLDTVINRLPVKYVYLPKATNTTETFRDLLTAVKNKGLKVSTAKAGVVLPLEGIDARFLAPVADAYDDLNDYSAVIRLEYGSQSFLLAGDASTISEDQMLSSGANLKSTVLKVGHHGSYSSTGSQFLQAVSPQYAVIMVGAGNSYGHPHAQTLSRLTAAGIRIYRTDYHGTVVFSTDGQTMQISSGG